MTDKKEVDKDLDKQMTDKYIHCCIDEICSIDSQSYNSTLNNLSKCNTIGEAMKYWETDNPNAFLDESKIHRRRNSQ